MTPTHRQLPPTATNPPPRKAHDLDAPLPQSDSVAVIGGTGALGLALARRWAAAGICVHIGSRSAESARACAAAIPGAQGGSYDEVVGECSTVVLTVPFAGHTQAVQVLANLMTPGQLLIDTTVPMSASSRRGLRPLTPFAGSAAQQAQDLLPDGIHVISALHTVSAAMLAEHHHRLDEDVLVFGDHHPSLQQAMTLIGAIEGLRPINAGTLDLSRVCEQLTPLIIGVNRRYKTHAGIKLTGLH